MHHDADRAPRNKAHHQCRDAPDRVGQDRRCGGQKGGVSDCTPVVGDQNRARVEWRESHEMGVENGKAVTLRVEMKQARIYGMEFE